MQYTINIILALILSLVTACGHQESVGLPGHIAQAPSQGTYSVPGTTSGPSTSRGYLPGEEGTVVPTPAPTGQQEGCVGAPCPLQPGA